MRLIDADSIELMDKAYSVFDRMREEWDAVISVNDIENAPTVDNRTLGRWDPIFCFSDRCETAITNTWECANCGAEVIQPEITRNCMYLYCPYCGSKNRW